MYSRRRFAGLVLAGIPAAATAAKINSTVNGVVFGAQSYSFRDRPLDGAIAGYKAVGLGVCELWNGHVEPTLGRGKEEREKLRKWRESVAPSELQAIRKKLDAAGIQLQAYSYAFREDMTDGEFEHGFVAAKALGVKLLTSSATVKAAKRLAPFAEKYKILVAMHNHSNVKDANEFARPESFEQALAMSKHYRINLDIGHFFAGGFDPVKYLEQHHETIVCLHIKDRKADQGANVPFGEGQTPIKETLQVLKAKKWKIPAHIEYEYKGGDTIEEVKRCFDYCKKAVA
jgi:sugar phosphate isomerase/epimerase